MKHQKYDIFISYRRDGGYETAQLLYDSLKQLGYRVSFDMETLRGGKFNEQLYSRIEQCSDVLAIMSKNSLALRENREDDWFRLEIAHALKHGKNIVPVFLRDFKFLDKKTLPPEFGRILIHCSRIHLRRNRRMRSMLGSDRWECCVRRTMITRLP